MGTDIHAHIEIKVDGEWLHYSQPRLERNYELFGRLCGVRNYSMDIPIVSPARGIPSDATKTTALSFEIERGHDASWADLSETAALMAWAEERFGGSFEHKQFGYLYGNGWTSENRVMRDGVVQDFRMIFWFD